MDWKEVLYHNYIVHIMHLMTETLSISHGLYMIVFLLSLFRLSRTAVQTNILRILVFLGGVITSGKQSLSIGLMKLTSLDIATLKKS